MAYALAAVFALVPLLVAFILYPQRRPLQGTRAHRRDVQGWALASVCTVPLAWSVFAAVVTKGL